MRVEPHCDGVGKRWLVRVCLAVSCAISGCASAPPKPQEPLPPISGMAVLPVIVEVVAEDPAAIRNAPRRSPTPVVVPGGQHLGGGDVAAAVLGVGLVAAVDSAVRGHLAGRAADLAEAVSSIEFRPAEILNAELPERLRRRGLNIALVTDGDPVRTARSEGQFKAVANGSPAVLDVRVGEHGYFSSLRAGGVSPFITITAALISADTGEELDSFYYYADWREKPKDPRWFAAPKSMIYADAADLAAHADEARAGLETLLQNMLEKIADDIDRRAKGEARAD